MQTPQSCPAPQRAARWPLLLAAALVAGGCSTLDVPRADNYPASGQHKARAVHHWDVLADDVAARVAAKVGAWPPGEYPLYVVPAHQASFQEGFRKLLITRLLERGLLVSTDPTDVVLNFDAQVVQHPTPVSSQVQLPMTALAAGVVVARDAITYAHSPLSIVAGTLAAGAALDAARLLTHGAAAGGPTRTEVLITTSLESGSRYLARTADIYYVAPRDAVLYQAAAPLPPPTPVKLWQVVAP